VSARARTAEADRLPLFVIAADIDNHIDRGVSARRCAAARPEADLLRTSDCARSLR